MGKEDYDIEKLPVGSKIKLGEDTPEQRVAKSAFHRYMLEYFREVKSGKTGWGVTFMDWLRMAKGWLHTPYTFGRKSFERIHFRRVESFEEDEPDETTDETQQE